MGDEGHGSWFDEARLGMFVHWGPSSAHGWELSWPMVGGMFALPGTEVDTDEYRRSFATFCPEPGAPREWARLAKAAGMGYAVLTTRHHDGFSLWPSVHAPEGNSIAATPYEGGQGDLVREFVDALRAEGLRVGFYYSLPDWSHPDYPAFGTPPADGPYAFIAYPRPDADAWNRYLDYLRGQLTELLTNYGTVDLLWFDGGWERTAEEWHAAELEDLIRSLQPDIVLNDRCPGIAGYETPEQFVPPTDPGHRWETCMTMNRSWGYVPTDTKWKSATELVHTVAEVAGRGGNLLLNIGPKGDGTLEPNEQACMEAVARWMAAHGDAIRGTTAGLEPWQFYGPTTRRGDRVYLHLLARPYESVTLRGVPVKRVGDVRLVPSGEPLSHRTRTAILDGLLQADPLGELTIDIAEAQLDPVATVIEVELRPPA